MHRSKQIVIASILTVLYTLQAIIRVAVALATQNQDAIDMGNGFLVVILILCTVCLVSVYGVWQNQKWGKVLAIITLGLNALPALAGIMTGDTSSSILFLSLDVLVAIVVTVLLLSRPKEAATG